MLPWFHEPLSQFVSDWEVLCWILIWKSMSVWFFFFCCCFFVSLWVQGCIMLGLYTVVELYEFNLNYLGGGKKCDSCSQFCRSWMKNCMCLYKITQFSNYFTAALSILSLIMVSLFIWRHVGLLLTETTCYAPLKSLVFHYGRRAWESLCHHTIWPLRLFVLCCI